MFLVTEGVNIPLQCLLQMVNCNLININGTTNEELVNVINYVMENKGIRAGDLGVTINLILVWLGVVRGVLLRICFAVP